MNKNIKVAFFLALIYFILVSRVFNQYILKRIPGTLDYDMITEKGAAVSAVFLALAFLLINFLVAEELI